MKFAHPTNTLLRTVVGLCSNDITYCCTIMLNEHNTTYRHKWHCWWWSQNFVGLIFDPCSQVEVPLGKTLKPKLLLRAQPLVCVWMGTVPIGRWHLRYTLWHKNASPHSNTVLMFSLLSANLICSLRISQVCYCGRDSEKNNLSGWHLPVGIPHPSCLHVLPPAELF